MNNKIKSNAEMVNLVKENEKLNKQVNTLKTIQHSVPTKLEIKKVIDITETVGSGTKEDPVREVHSLWDINTGLLIKTYEN